ncbi:MAG TPA: hypothetical protein VMQ65_02200 [Candidatus Limnocylindria bacterium]|nr:hypothetical protein [Candidatus Limnocylindria bacterium]
MSNPTPGMTSGNRHASFVVRVWTESTTLPSARGAAAGADETADLAIGDLARAGLRGSVEHVGSRALRYFASLETMREIIAEVVERSSSSALTPPDSSRNVR